MLNADYQIFMATSGTQAISLCKSNPPDLILLDVEMPGLNGFEVCQQLKAEAPRYAKLIPELPRLVHLFLQHQSQHTPNPQTQALLAEQRLQRPVRLVCQEGRFEALCSDLVQHSVDVVLAERPGGQGTAHLQVAKLLTYPVRIFASPVLKAKYQDNFPQSLQHAPFLMPSRNNVLRLKLEHWLESVGVEVTVVGEFDDLALLETFGRAGLGLFAVPALLIEDVVRDNTLVHMGDAQGVVEDFFAFTHPRNLNHPALKLLFGANPNTNPNRPE